MTRNHLHHVAELILQDWYTIDNLAELLGLSAALIDRAAGNGNLPTTPGGHGERWVRHEDVMEWLRRRPYASEPVLGRLGTFEADSTRSIS